MMVPLSPRPQPPSARTLSSSCPSLDAPPTPSWLSLHLRPSFSSCLSHIVSFALSLTPLPIPSYLCLPGFPSPLKSSSFRLSPTLRLLLRPLPHVFSSPYYLRLPLVPFRFLRTVSLSSHYSLLSPHPSPSSSPSYFSHMPETPISFPN